MCIMTTWIPMYLYFLRRTKLGFKIFLKDKIVLLTSSLIITCHFPIRYESLKLMTILCGNGQPLRNTNTGLINRVISQMTST